MAYKHGVYTDEQPTGLVSMTATDSGLIVAFGTAPVHLVANPKVNEPILCYTYAEAVQAMGYTDDWKNYTLCEVIKQQFAYYNMAPVVLVNVLDPTEHKQGATYESVAFNNGVAEIAKAIYIPSVKVYLMDEGTSGSPTYTELTKDTDYTVMYNEDNKLVITAIEDGELDGEATAYVSYDEIKPQLVTGTDIVGGIDSETGKAKGLELLDEIYHRFGIVPGTIIAPGFSDNSSVANAMIGKTTGIGGLFNAIAICDIPTNAVTTYTDASEWKNEHSIVDKNMIACWPMVRLGDEISHLSTHLASLMNKVDSEHDDVPYYAPSNKSLRADGACLQDGTEIWLNNKQAEYLNGQGITTALNFIGGWRSWGVQSAAYPSNTDVKDNQIVNRRMFNWVGNTLITTFWSKIDDPANKRLIQTVVDSAGVWLNGLVRKGALLGGRVEFRYDDNVVTDIMSGILKFHVFITPPAAAKEIHFIQEYDPQYINTLFE